ncbi:MAG: cysteine-rich small domain-containing protein [Candidatus Omnitrophota bacterium]
MKKKILRINKHCAYFPCHTELEDCTFCFCPFYPCRDRSKGKYIRVEKSKKKVWSCESCIWIHKRIVVDEIFNLIDQKRQNSTNKFCDYVI